ncbi:MAG: ATP-binding protein [Clostridiales bacterium]|nr:ATP-binding protein [Clostridiales bacterium]MDY3745452.1 ATP-binding protein [Lachnospiraceae bacterium]
MTLDDIPEQLMLQIQNDIIRKERSLQTGYYRLAATLADEMRELKHDMSNQLQIMYALIMEGSESSKNTAEKMLEDMQKRLASIQNIVYCNQPIVNAVLAIKDSECHKFGIRTDIKIGEIGQLIFAEADLCSLFSNLFDNAIEACMKNNDSKKYICIRAAEKAGFLLVKFTNSYSGVITKDTDGFPKTSKEDSRHHGHGLKIIQKIAKKYNGSMKIATEDNEFIVVVMLKIWLKVYVKDDI